MEVLCIDLENKNFLTFLLNYLIRLYGRIESLMIEGMTAWFQLTELTLKSTSHTPTIGFGANVGYPPNLRGQEFATKCAFAS